MQVQQQLVWASMQEPIFWDDRDDTDDYLGCFNRGACATKRTNIRFGYGTLVFSSSNKLENAFKNSYCSMNKHMH